MSLLCGVLATAHGLSTPVPVARLGARAVALPRIAARVVLLQDESAAVIKMTASAEEPKSSFAQFSETFSNLFPVWTVSVAALGPAPACGPRRHLDERLRCSARHADALDGNHTLARGFQARAQEAWCRRSRFVHVLWSDACNGARSLQSTRPLAGPHRWHGPHRFDQRRLSLQPLHVHCEWRRRAFSHDDDSHNNRSHFHDATHLQ
jgi:hypothetical protein